MKTPENKSTDKTPYFLIGLCNVAGAFLSGVWSGRVFKRTLLVGIYIGRAVAITLFLLLPIQEKPVLRLTGQPAGT